MIRSDTYLTLDRDGSKFSVGVGSHKARTHPTSTASHYTWHKAFSTALSIIAAKHCRVRRVVIYLEEKDNGSTS
jgi:hypothetical protein